MVAGFLVIWFSGASTGMAWSHLTFGYCVLGFGALQFMAGWLRGTRAARPTVHCGAIITT